MGKAGPWFQVARAETHCADEEYSSKAKAGRKPGLCEMFRKSKEKAARSRRLKFCVGVGADLAVEVDLFVLRCGPFHG